MKEAISWSCLFLFVLLVVSLRGCFLPDALTPALYVGEVVYAVFLAIAVLLWKVDLAKILYINGALMVGLLPVLGNLSRNPSILWTPIVLVFFAVFVARVISPRIGVLFWRLSVVYVGQMIVVFGMTVFMSEWLSVLFGVIGIFALHEFGWMCDWCDRRSNRLIIIRAKQTEPALPP